MTNNINPKSQIPNPTPRQRGALLIELLVAISILAIILSVGTESVFVSIQSGKTSGDTDVAVGLASEAIEAARAVSDEKWQNIYNLTHTGAATTPSYPVGSHPRGIAFDPLTNSVWVVNSGDNTVTKLNASDGSTVCAQAVGNYPTDVVFDSYTNSVWVLNAWDNGVTKIDPSTCLPVGTETIITMSSTAYPGGIVSDAAGSIWVGLNDVASANSPDSDVAKINASTGAVASIYHLVGDKWLQGIAFDPSTNSVWLASGATGAIKVNAATGAISGKWIVGWGPMGLAYDPLSNSIWAANQTGNDVYKIRASDGALSGPYTVAPLGSNSQKVAYDPSTNSVWSLNATSKNVTKLNAVTGAIVSTVSVGNTNANFPPGIAFDSSTNSLWVTNYADNTVTKIKASDASIVMNDATHYKVIQSAGKWVIGSGSESILLNGTAYTRYISVQNVCRDSSSRNITGITDSNGAATACTMSGGAFDPSTQKVTATVSWQGSGSPVIISDYFSRWKNKTCGQTGWTGGIGSGVKTCGNTTYVTSTNIATSTSLQLCAKDGCI